MPVMGIGARKAIAVLAASMIWLVGLGPFLLVQPPITLIAGSIGV
jgi:omega-6 fatty acid desaturase (delta-12 desaturase)